MESTGRHRIPSAARAFAAALLLAGAAACTDDMDTQGTRRGTTLSFEVGESASPWSAVAGTRSTDESAADSLSPLPAPQVLAMRGDDLSDTLYLHATVEEGIDAAHIGNKKTETRAATVTKDNFYTAIGVFSYIWPATDAWAETLTPNYMYNARVTESSGWTTSYFWPGGGYKTRFFAYAPYEGGSSGTGIALSAMTDAGAPQITYTVPTDVAEQQDLLAAASAAQAGDHNQSLPLGFYHALTAVKFVTGDDMLPGKVSKIAIKGVHGKGTHTMGSTSGWTADGTTADFSQELSVTVDGTSGQAVTSEAQTFMMIPQTLPAGATIEVTYTDDLTSTERTLTADVAGSEWLMGKTYTYKLSTSSIAVTPVFVVTDFSAFTYSGGEQNRYVTSYINISGTTTQIPVAWTAEFVEDDGAGGYRVIGQPSWVTAFTTSGEGGTNNTLKASVSAQTATNHESNLKGAASVSLYNLSNSTGASDVENTANCYIVNAPGTYILPLVYGNAIKNGTRYESAYKTSATGSVLATFVNHLGNGITDPYIYNNASCLPGSAKLVWQDAPNLVTNVALHSNKCYLTFEVSKDNIVPGNAVVAVCDSNGDIMWSWHIWVTDYKLGEDLKTVGSYSFLPYNLGWVDDATAYEGRSVKVRFTQQGTGETKVVDLVQSEGYVNAYYFRNCFFQWGRKDPMISNKVQSSYNDFYRQWITTNSAITWYDTNGTASSSWAKSDFGGGTNEIASCIKNPHCFDKNDDDMFKSYNNMWSADNTSDASTTVATTVKTVYDPSPAGYKVPPVTALTALSNAGRTWDGTRKGFMITCTDGTASFFPALGRAYINGSTYEMVFGVTENTPYGYYWSALPAAYSGNYTNAYHIYFNSSMFQTYGIPRIYAESIRPVAE